MHRLGGGGSVHLILFHHIRSLHIIRILRELQEHMIMLYGKECNFVYCIIISLLLMLEWFSYAKMTYESFIYDIWNNSRFLAVSFPSAWLR